MSKLKAIIFDMDGTLVDSQLNFDQMRRDIGIPGNEPILEYLETIQDKDYLKQAHQIVHQHELKGAEVATLIRDAGHFLQWLEEQEIPSGVLTRNSKEITTLTFERLNLSFDQILTRDCCTPKPAPDGLLQIAASWSLPPQEIIYIGDFKFDIETAKNAGMKSGLISLEKNKEFQADADIVFTQFEELKTLFV
jgi:HAD superfamily hydrolase (TIGR01509 family)